MSRMIQSLNLGECECSSGLSSTRSGSSIIKLSALLVTFWSVVSPQLVAMTLQYSSANNGFPDSYAGVYIQHPTQKLLAYTYASKPSFGSWYLKLYNADSGVEVGSVSSSSYSSVESMGVAGTSYIAVLEKTQGVFIYQLQSVTSGSVALAYQSSLSSTSLTSKYFSSPISDPLTTYVYANYFGTLAYYTSPQVTVYKMDIMNLAGIKTGPITPATMYPSGKYSFGMGFYINDVFICMITTGAKFISMTNLTLLYDIMGSDLGYAVVQEPSELNVTYMSTYTGTSVEKRRPVTSAAAQTILASVNAGSATVTNMIRCPFFRLLMINSNSTSIIKFIDVDAFTGVLSYQPSFSGTIARMSLTSSKFESRKWYVSFINTDAKRFEYYYLTMDYCLVPGQNPCLQCIAGRYLDSAATDNNCLKPAEFPVGYGISGYYIGICLSDPTNGCLACTTVSTCTKCDIASGFYLYQVTGLCYKQPNFPASTGLNISTNLIETCTTANCKLCSPNKAVCTECNLNYYFKESSTATCYSNNIDTFGLKTVGTTQVLAVCQLSNCKTCSSDYTVCTACTAGYYFKEGSTSQCYTNTLDFFGLKTVGPNTVMASCTDANCVLCRANNAMCTKCKAGFFVNGTTCMAAQAGMGEDGSGVTLKPCTVPHCIDCGANYTLCYDCESPYYLLENQHISCNLNNQNYRGLKDVGGQPMLSPCTVTNCKSCLPGYDHCQVCENTYYPVKEDDTVCSKNTIPGRGLEFLSGALVLSKCSDPNCKLCYTSSSFCTECNSGYYQVVGRETEDPSCRVSLDGYGLPPGAAPNKKLTPCVDKNCSDCAADNTVCNSCMDTYYPLLSVSGNCTLNNMPGLGIYVDSNGKSFLSSCQLPNCALCYKNVMSCMNCTEPLILNPMTGRCIENDVKGMGKFTDPENFAYLVNCYIEGCASCSAAYDLCKACVSAEMDIMDDKCVWRNTKRIGIRQPIYFNKKGNSFLLYFDGGLYPNISNVLEGYSYSLKRHDSSEIESIKFSIDVVRTGDKSFSGSINTKENIEESTLTMTSKNTSIAYLRNNTNLFDPNEPIIVNEVAFSNYAQDTDKGLDTVMRASMTAAAVAGALTLGSNGNSRQAAMMIKVIDSVEFTLYLNGVRVYRALYFLYILQRNFLQLVPSIYKFDEDSLHCIPHSNFDREQVSCNFLNNFGSELSTIAAGIAMILVVRFALKYVNRIKGTTSGKRRLKSVLSVVLWLPARLFGTSLLIVMVDGSQIDVFRLCFLNILTVNTSLGMIIGAIMSGLLLTVYGGFGYLLYKAGQKHSTAAIKDDSLLDHEPRHDVSTARREISPGGADANKQNAKESEEKVKGFFDVSEILEGFKPANLGSMKYRYYLPVIMLTKNMLTQFTIVFLVGLKNGQLGVILGLECIGLIVTVWFRPFAKLTDKITSTMSAAALTFIGITNVLVNIHGVKLSFRDREVYYGSVLIGLYILAILIGVLPMIVEAIRNLVTLVKRFLPKRKNKISKTEKSKHNAISSSTTSATISPRLPGSTSARKCKRISQISPELKDTYTRRNITTSSLKRLGSGSSIRTLNVSKLKPTIMIAISSIPSKSESLRRNNRLISGSLRDTNKSQSDSLQLLTPTLMKQ